MKKYQLPIIFALLLTFSSCNFFSSLFSGPPEPKYPDTLVLATIGYNADVQFNLNDSLYVITRYWTDNNGKWLYKLKEEPYKRGRLHGKRVIWNEWGDTLHFSIWEEGISRDSMFECYTDSVKQRKQLVYYLPNGNKDYEVYYHKNGKPRTDTIYYVKGLREGAIDFYDDDPKNLKPIETYFYKNDELIGVQIYKALYDNLASRAANLRAQIAKDSIAAATQRLALSGTAELANQKAIEGNRTKSQEYKGNASNDVDADVW